MPIDVDCLVRTPSYRLGSTISENAPSKSVEYYDIAADKHKAISFIGRKELIDKIHQTLESLSHPTRTVVLQGLGGQGKTQLAIQYSYVYHYKNPRYKLVFWVDATSQSTTEASYGRIADNFGPD